MEKELRERLDKTAEEHNLSEHSAPILLNITVAVLQAIIAHVLEVHPDRQGEIVIADTAIGLVKDYR